MTTPSTTRRALGLLALVGMLALPQVASAQSRAQRGDGDRAEQQITRLDEALDLTDAQAVQLRTLFAAQQANRPARGARPDREAMQAQRAEMDRQVEAILTPAQVERYRALQASRQQRGQRGGQRGDGQRNGR